MHKKKIFHFKKFSVHHDRCTMKVGTDGVLVGSWSRTEGAQRILDIGTGSGVIALIMAQRTNEHVRIDAVEISEVDFLQARENFLAAPWKERMEIFHADIRQFSPGYQYDLIVSNPPFFSNSLPPPDRTRELVRHTTSLSHNDLIEVCIKLLTPSGRLNVILPLSEGQRFSDFALTKSLYCRRATALKTRKEKPVERLLLEFSRLPGELEKTEMLLYSDGEKPSMEYRSLTGSFYLNF